MNRLLSGLRACALSLVFIALGASPLPAAAQVFANGPLKVQQVGDWTFGLSGPVPAGSNVIGGVTQSGPWTVALTGSIPPGANAIGSVLADLRVAGSAVAAGNPVPITGPVSVTNFPATQAVTNAGTFAVQNTAALPAGTNAIGTVILGAGSASVGTIGNAAFGISGTLPAFAATPTFNVGSTNGLALDATLTGRLGTLGQKAATGSAPVVLASDQPAVPIQGGNATAVKTDGSASTQPVSGTVTANQGAPGATPWKVDGSAVTQPTSTTNGATAANQASEIAALGAIGDAAYGGSGTASIVAALKGIYVSLNTATIYGSEALGSGALAANATANGATHDAGTSPSAFATFNATVQAQATGTLKIQASADASGWVDVATVAMTTQYTVYPISARILTRFYRVVVVNGNSAAAGQTYTNWSFSKS